ncbi:MAG: hypothetical protein V1780_01910 [Chloroflexota bacterium]
MKRVAIIGGGAVKPGKYREQPESEIARRSSGWPWRTPVSPRKR